MVLRIGELFLRLFDSCQSLVETIDCRFTDPGHRTATVEDNHIEYLRLLHFILAVLLFHFSKEFKG